VGEAYNPGPDYMAELARELARGRKYVALVVVAAIIAAVVLALDYMIKNAIVEQVRQADRLLDHVRNPDGTEPETDAGHAGRAGRVFRRDSVDDASRVGTGPHDGSGPVPGTIGHRVAGPPVSTDSDARGTEDGRPASGGMALPDDRAPEQAP